MPLRWYQEEACERIDHFTQQGIKEQCLVFPTGAGKTHVFCHLIQDRKCPTLVIVHRDELVNQTAAKILDVWPEADIGVVKAKKNEYGANVVIASQQTVQNAHRLFPILREKKRQLVIIDEAHHVEAPTLKKKGGNTWYQIMQACIPAAETVLGCTATPFRDDNKSIIGPGRPFKIAPKTMGVAEAIYHGILVKPVAKQLQIVIDLDKVHVRGGDFVPEELDALTSEPDKIQGFFDGWAKHASTRRTLVYVPGVVTAGEMAKYFRAKGIPSAVIIGSTPTEERKAIYRLWEKWEIQVVVNCMVLTEGFDQTYIDCIAIFRPMLSRVLYQQSIGRGLRIHPGKEDCFILDCNAASSRHQFMSMQYLLDKNNSYGLIDDDEKELEEEEEEELEEEERREIRKRRLKAKAYSKSINIIRKNPLKWNMHNDGEFMLDLISGAIAVESQDDLGEYWGTSYYDYQNNTETQLVSHVNDDIAFGVAEDTVRDIMRDENKKLIKKKERWLHYSPTEKQLALADKMGIKYDDTMNRGQLNDLISLVKFKQVKAACRYLPHVKRGLESLSRKTKWSSDWDKKFSAEQVELLQQRGDMYFCSHKQAAVIARMVRKYFAKYEEALRCAQSIDDALEELERVIA